MLFGKIKSIPLPQVAKMIGDKSGIIEITTPENELYKFFFSKRLFLGAEKQNVLIENIFTLRSILSELSEKHESRFLFKEISIESKISGFSLTLDQFIIASLHPLKIKYQKTTADFYPDPDTVFINTGTDTSCIGCDFLLFWIEAQPFFSRGTSAKELSKFLFFSLEDILYYTYTLNLLDIIRLADKKRVFQLPLLKTPQMQNVENKTELALVSSSTPIEEKSSPYPVQTTTESQAIQLYQVDNQQKKGLLRRLIYGFKNFFRKMYE
ncbi:Fis family transcriptional regulator [Methylacidiphilum caldifontis]|uniref:Fis family transcriptional regulator n=1 Tax=Methylacidiphilum caldifontis TaxID=2795386 RepID=A0A4Y8PDC8_9BACT|nr:Fis family transcriptional regulator [Methylacidiphilum caldifontis]TFE69527.1 Fis family transcriptional regulator [Methylacidiphilum caldifontis]